VGDEGEIGRGWEGRLGREKGEGCNREMEERRGEDAGDGSGGE